MNWMTAQLIVAWYRRRPSHYSNSSVILEVHHLYPRNRNKPSSSSSLYSTSSSASSSLLSSSSSSSSRSTLPDEGAWTDDTPCEYKKLCYCRHLREVLRRLTTVWTDKYTSVEKGRLPLQSTQHFDLCGRSHIGSNLFHRPPRQITVHEASGWALVARLIVELYSLCSASAAGKNEWKYLFEPQWISSGFDTWLKVSSSS